MDKDPFNFRIETFIPKGAKYYKFRIYQSYDGGSETKLAWDAGYPSSRQLTISPGEYFTRRGATRKARRLIKKVILPKLVPPEDTTRSTTFSVTPKGR